MKNSITATIAFDFKGERFTPSLEIDLDSHMESIGKLPDFHGLIAAANNIGIYSYEYEMLLAEEITITDAQGIIKDYIVDGILDAEAFESVWLEHTALQIIQTIVDKNMNLADLQKHPEFIKTLLAVYKAGQDNPLQDKDQTTHVSY